MYILQIYIICNIYHCKLYIIYIVLYTIYTIYIEYNLFLKLRTIDKLLSYLNNRLDFSILTFINDCHDYPGENTLQNCLLKLTDRAYFTKYIRLRSPS